MLSFEALCAEFAELEAARLRDWIAAGHVRAEATPEGPRFGPIDVARVRLILTLERELAVDEAALPLVLQLLDELYALRRELRRRTAGGYS